jgi:hypothetical protein
MRHIALVLTATAAIAAIRRLLQSGNTVDVGLGDLIKRATNAVGIQPCEGCARRAAALNRRVPFSNPAANGYRSRGQ